MQTEPRQIQRILIANRGEIAVRVIKTARQLRIGTVAVHSEADASAPHVDLADEAVSIGPAPVSESYLDIDKILEAARTTEADAIHPGYGFLSENATFARACEDAGLIFIGPSPEAIRLMGNKAEAKRRMIDADVPCVPGYQGEDQSDAAFLKAAHRIGFPIMVKAAAGGGGRGMRLVASEGDLLAALDLARSESKSAFGSDELILERAVIRPRHVEVQVLADSNGAVIHLGERDCSVQRRHQKVLEEAPCPVMTRELRNQMGDAAVEAARSIGYRGAGTVEFLLDEDGRFYFLEMNTRLQVEHPVTEMITGLDLVALQIHVAQGKPLGIRQEDVALNGHAIEARLYAEDPAQDFLPSTGLVELFEPARGEGLRFDSGTRTGLEVSPFYDPMVAKIIAWGPDREAARLRLISALEETVLLGPRSNQHFLLECLKSEAFADGEVTTAFIDEHLGSEQARGPSLEDAAVAAVLELIDQREAAMAEAVHVAPALANWSSTGSLLTRYRYDPGDRQYDLAVTPLGKDSYRITCADEQVIVDDIRAKPGAAVTRVAGRRRKVRYQRGEDGRIYLAEGGRTWSFENALSKTDTGERGGGGGRVVAPMHGRVIEVSVASGGRVRKGDRLCVVEAMKMQHEILADVDGQVVDVPVEAGDQVAADDLLLEIRLEETAA